MGGAERAAIQVRMRQHRRGDGHADDDQPAEAPPRAAHGRRWPTHDGDERQRNGAAKDALAEAARHEAGTGQERAEHGGTPRQPAAAMAPEANSPGAAGRAWDVAGSAGRSVTTR